MSASKTIRLALPLLVASLSLTTCGPTLAMLSVRSTPAAPRPVTSAAPPSEPAVGLSVATAGPDELGHLPRLAPPPLPGSRTTGGEGPTTPAAGSPEPAPTFTPVRTHVPRVRLAASAEPDRVLADALRDPAVSFATVVELAQTTVAGPQGPMSITVAGVDPAGFRVLAPQVTADAVAVWDRLVEGDLAVTHDVGNRLGTELGADVVTAAGAVRVGALASNGVPPIADGVVSRETARRLGLRGAPVVLVAVDEGADAAEVASRLAEATGAEADVVAEPVSRRAFLTGGAARKAFEPYTYIDNGDGMITIDPGWVRRNIVRAKVPVFRGEVVCHRLMIPQLRGALEEVVARGLDHLIDPSQYGGCWVPRHIDWNPAKPLSMHSWGLAVDFNVSTNGLGRPPQLDPRIVEVFDRWGFVWGGRWNRPDGMHFELGALLQSTGG